MNPRAKLMSLLGCFIKRDPYGNVCARYIDEIVDAIMDMVDEKYRHLLENENGSKETKHTDAPEIGSKYQAPKSTSGESGDDSTS